MNEEMRKTEEESGRKMPASVTSERALLGSVLIDPPTLTELIVNIAPEDFYLSEHREIYIAMRELFEASREIDEVTLIDMLVRRGVYDKAGGEEYIRALLAATPVAANVADYARIVREQSIRRRVITACAEIAEMSYADQGEVGDLLDHAQGTFNDIAAGRDNRAFCDIKDVMKDVLGDLRVLSEDKDAFAGIPTGFSGLDKYLAGMGESDLILIGARPGMGKTSFAMNIATQVAQQTPKNGEEPKTVCVFSLEMSAKELVVRMLSSEALIDSYSLRSGLLTNEDWTKLTHACARLANTHILIDDTSAATVTSMKAKLRQVPNPGLVVVDYLQLMHGEHRADNRATEVSEISRNLKLLAKDLRVPVICCSQLNRGPEGRTDKRPQLSDLRESGSIEQDADVVMLLYRDEYYKNDADPTHAKGNIAEVLIQKNRHGSLGRVEMGWLPQYTKFRTLDDQHNA